jgi:hypothetical protein
LPGVGVLRRHDHYIGYIPIHLSIGVGEYSFKLPQSFLRRSDFTPR